MEANMNEDASQTSDEVCAKLDKYRVSDHSNKNDNDEDDGPIMVVPVKKSSKRKKKKVIPSIRIYWGTFVHSTMDNPMEIMNDYIIGVDKGKILFVEPATKYEDFVQDYKLTDVSKECTVRIGESCFMMPGFVDAHACPLRNLVSGLQLDGEDSQRRLQQKLHLVRSDKVACQLFEDYVERSLGCGTTCASYDGTAIESAYRLLADTLESYGQRAIVGYELSCEQKKEDVHIWQLMKAKDILNNALHRQYSRVRPIIQLSSLLPPELQDKARDLDTTNQIGMKISVAERPLSDCNGHRNGFVPVKESEVGYLEEHDMMDNKKQLLHCRYCSGDDMNKIKSCGASVCYCPTGVTQQHGTSSGESDLKALVGMDLKVGLGTGGNCQNMLEAIRQAVSSIQNSISRPCLKRVTEEIVQNGTASEEEAVVKKTKVELIPVELRNVTFKDVFRIATLGGAQALGLGDQIGNFEVGKDFDAIMINPCVPRSRITVFKSHDTKQDIIEKFLFLGDDRNITDVIIGGESVINHV